MTIHHPETEDQPPPSMNGRDAVAADTDLATRHDAFRGNGTTPARPKRATDYRLRGLDLDVVLAEEADRPVRKKHPSVRRRRRRLIVQWIVVLAVTALVAMFLRASVVEPFSVSSASMVPTLPAGTGALVVKSSLLTGPVKTGDIVVYRQPAGSTCSSGGHDAHRLVDRVIGLPGQTIWSVRGRISVDGKRLDEPGWYNPPFGELGPTAIRRTTIPAGSYFVMGDNRTDSCDSRAFGPIAKSLLVGKVVAIVTRNGHPFVHSV
jgi:signal peptidase I